MTNAKLLRSALFLPASNQRAIDKSRGISADAVLFDLEDAVAPEAKEMAREQLVAAFADGDFGGSATAVRTNQINSAEYLKDLDAIEACTPGAVILPKVSSVSDIETFEADAINRGYKNSCRVWYMIETAAGLVNLADIIQAGLNSRYRLECLIIGHNDLALDTGVSLDGDRQYLLPWLMQVILQSSHAGIAVLDSVYNQFKDLDGFAREAKQASAMGFTGKALIHPSQVDVCNEVFSPDTEALAEARKIVAAFAQPENAAAGVISLDGRMVERLHLEQAQAMLERFT